VSTAGLLCALPVAVFEFAVGVHLTVKGFRPAGLAALDAPSGTVGARAAGSVSSRSGFDPGRDQDGPEGAVGCGFGGHQAHSGFLGRAGGEELKADLRQPVEERRRAGDA
jgi:hypothetical protein